jgi:hypothetical protein
MLVNIRIATHAALLALVACTEPTPQYPASAPPEIARACALAEHKCTACHDRERFLVPRHPPERWEKIVHRMRLLPGSSIMPADAEIILRCLNYRSSATSLDSHPRLPERDERGDVYVMRHGEVQALHFAVAQPMHPAPNFGAFAMCNPLE